MKFKFTRKARGGGYLNNKKITPKKKTALGILVGLVLFGSGVAAATYFSANQVSYTPSDTSWNVSDVKGALDDLYSNILNASYDKSMEFKGLSVTIGKGGSDDEARFFLTGGSVLPFPVSNFSKVDITNLKLTSTYQDANYRTGMYVYLQVSKDGSSWSTVQTITKADTVSSITKSTSIDVSNYDYFRIYLGLQSSWYNGKHTPTAQMTIGTIKLS